MSILGAGGLGELGISTESLGWDLKGRSPQSSLVGSSVLTKTYAFEIFATAASAGAPQGALSPSHVYFFALNPQQISFSDYSAGTTTYTAGGVIAEGGAKFLRQYTLTGRSGVARRRGYSAGEIPSGVNPNMPARITADGHRLFRELHKFFDHYSNIKNDPSAAYAWGMAFHDFINDDAFVINPRQFSVDRKAGGDYQYTITFDAIAERHSTVLGLLQQAGPFVDRVLTAGSTIVGSVSGLANDILDAGAEIGGMVLQGAKTINMLSRELSATALRVRGIPAAFEQLGSQLKTSLSDTYETLRQLGVDPADKEQVNQAAAQKSQETANAAVELQVIRMAQRAVNSSQSREVTAIEAQQTSLPVQAIDENYDPLSSAALLRMRRMCLIAESSFLGAQLSAARESEALSSARAQTDGSALSVLMSSAIAAPDFSSLPTTEIVVLRGDTLASIAQRACGDRRALNYIARLNALSYPYISDSGEPNTVKYGAKIIVPSLAPAAGTPAYADKRAALDMRLFGTDMLLTQDGDLVASGDLTDVATVSGVSNIKQSLEVIRFRTPVGSNILFPAIGYPNIIGDAASNDAVFSAIIGAKQCVKSDARIASVKIEQATDVGDGVVVALTCRTINNAQAFSVGFARNN